MSVHQELGSGQGLAYYPEVYDRYAGIMVHRVLQKRRATPGESVSETHSENHLRGVSELSKVIAEEYGLPQREVVLVQIPSRFHDSERSGREDLGLQDEQASVDQLNRFLDHAEMRGKFSVSLDEREAMGFATLYHGKTPAHFKDPLTKEDTPVELKDRLHTVLYVADALQKLGFPLIYRRSAFVGGERIGVNKEGKRGDMIDMTHQGVPIDPVSAVLLESAVRLGWKNSEGDYPKRLARFIQEPFRIQREWVTGLLAARGLTLATWSEMLMSTFAPKGENVFQLAKSNLDNVPATVQEVEEILLARSGITPEMIQEASFDPDLMSSSVEAVEYFSGRFLEDTGKVIREWNPQGEHAKMWKKGM